MPPVPKYVAYRNPKILAFAKGQACQHCGTNDGTTVAAHSNVMEDGKGVGKKSDDCFVAFLDHKCHEQYDKKLRERWNDHNGAPQSKLLFTQYDFDKAMKRTWKLLLTHKILK